MHRDRRNRAARPGPLAPGLPDCLGSAAGASAPVSAPGADLQAWSAAVRVHTLARRPAKSRNRRHRRPRSVPRLTRCAAGVHLPCLQELVKSAEHAIDGRCGAEELGEHLNPVSSLSRRARGKVTAWLFFCRRGHRHRRAPWPGPHRVPWVGREDLMPGALAPETRPVDTDLLHCLSSPRSAAHPGCGGWAQPGPVGPALRGTVRIPAVVGRHPKVPAGWNVATGPIPHPKVVLGRLGCGVRGSGRAAGPGRRLRCGWRHRACPRRGSRAF